MQQDGTNKKSAQKAHLQFTLTKALLFPVVVALSLATFGMLGIAIVIFLIAQVVFFRRAANRVELIAAYGIGFLFLSCVAHGHREAARQSSCRNNLKLIGLALHNYHNEYGQFPPQYVADAEGRPMHSWRVLILPYLSDSDGVYQEYRFNEPWNSQHNQTLADRAERMFRCMTTNAAEPDSPFATHYVAVVGPNTAWPKGAGIRLKDFADGTASTVLLMEIANSDIHWMEPRDLPLEDLSGENGECRVPSSHHFLERTYFFYNTHSLAGNVLMADGSCHCFESQPSRDEVAALLSTDGGETINDSLLKWHRRTLLQRLDLKRCLSYALLLIFLALLVW